MTKPLQHFKRHYRWRQTTSQSLAYLGVAMAGKGDHDRALDIAKEVKTAENRTEPALLLAAIYAKLDLAAEMYEWLERAIALKSGPMYLVVLNEEYFPHHTDPRFHRFLASIGLSHRARV